MASGKGKALLVAAAAVLLAVVFINTSGGYAGLRERVLDEIAARTARIPVDAQPVVVDIDRAALAAGHGPQLRRSALTALVSRLADEGAAVVAVDILLEGEGTNSAAYHARQLADLVRDPTVVRLARELESDNAVLAAAAARTKLILGLALSPEATEGRLQTAPVLLRGAPDPARWWSAPGIRAPAEALRAASAGLGIIALPGDADAVVRRVPLVALSERRAIPGLALEAIRVADGAGAYLVAGAGGTIASGPRTIHLAEDGMLRLVASTPEVRAARTIDAVTLMSGLAAGRLRGRTVLVGSSAPELGGLRPGSGGELAPSVQIQADAVAQIRAGVVPVRTRRVALVETLAALAFAAAAAVAALSLAPVAGAAVVVAGCSAWAVGAIGLFPVRHVLADPLAGPLVAVAAYMTAAIATAAETRRRVAGLQRRFEQHLAPAIVARIVANPMSLKLEGERRTVTSLFTDLEGFTAMTERVDPEALVALLDRYLAGVSAVVVAHGGMVDKFVGDAVHALFNAPLDMPEHTRAALDCARAIDAFAEQLRAEPAASRLGLGRTRIGIERGEVIVGDVGGGGKLDYTALGTAINTAARLEAANKVLGSTICVGPVAASALAPGVLRPAGEVVLRGLAAPVPAFTPWPDAYSDADRDAYLAAFDLLQSDPRRAAGAFDEVRRRHPADAVARSLAERAVRGPEPSGGQRS